MTRKQITDKEYNKRCGYAPQKRWLRKNKNKFREYQKVWVSENREHLRRYKREYAKTREGLDIEFKIMVRLRNRLAAGLRHNLKSRKTIDLLGCSVEDFKIYLESKFEPGMSWDNYGLGGWE